MKVMTANEYDFAVNLANTMKWGMETADFKFNQALEPEGCFVLFENTEPVGIATCISFGKIGWFGNLIVKPKQRKQGAGHQLLEHAIKYLQDKGVKTIGLYAYEHLKEFYSKLGFKPDIDLTVMHNENVQVNYENLPKFESQPDFSALNHFDGAFFGADRSRLLTRIIENKNNLCFASLNDKKVDGYILAKVNENVSEVGPLVCNPDKPELAVELLKAVLNGLEGKFVSLYVPQKQEELVSFLGVAGFKKDFTLSRMFLGTPLIQNSIHLAESLERG